MSENNPEIILYGLYKRGNIVSSVSPFVTKVETFLLMNEIPYQGILASPFTGPKGKVFTQVPYIKHRDQIITDSHFIIEYLIKYYDEKGQKLAITHPQSPLDRAICTACERVVEEHLPFVQNYFIFFDDGGWNRQKQFMLREFFSPMLRSVIVQVGRYMICSGLKSQGVGRLTQDEILKVAKEDLQMIDTFLGDKQYLTGDVPVAVDCALFGFLDNSLNLEERQEDGIFENPLANLIQQKFPRLVDYNCRIREQFYNNTPTESFRKQT